MRAKRTGWCGRNWGERRIGTQAFRRCGQIMNRHALNTLQFPEVLDLVAKFAASSLGAAAVRSLEPSDVVAWITEELRRVDQMIGLLLKAEDWFVPPIPDLHVALRRLNTEGSVWDGPALRDAGELLRSARAVRRSTLQHASDFPLLAQIAEKLVKLDAIEEQLRGAIDDAGDVRDHASRELGRLRADIRGARSRIVQKLEQFVAGLPARFQVPDASVTVRDGRYVIPIRREGRGDVGGIVHDESATGNTLFIEPPVALELMNRLRELELAEVREVQRILRALTDVLRPHGQALQDTLAALVTIDALFARARYALEYNGRRPEILPRASHEYNVVEGYHPLLLASGTRVVAFDLRLEPGERTLLVSGPNTGGKTVLLKAIGLISAMSQAGIIPPVGAGTKLPLFADIFADIGDEQSIEASLSTFSAHLKNLREILENADGNTLALIDEIGSGTDPAEGGALAQAILVELTGRGTTTVATTHLGQLKLLAAEQEGVVNASLQFDATELKPTYRLQKGIPGRSYGLAIARRLGFPADLLSTAEGFLPAAERDVANLLLELEEKERGMARALREAQSARTEALELQKRVQEREHVIRQREHDAERRVRQQARDILLQARHEVETAIREVREAATLDAPEQLDEAFRTARRRVEERAHKQLEHLDKDNDDDVPEPLEPSGAPVEIGARVRIAATGAEGIVIELRDGRATVEAGGVRLQVPERGLSVLAAEKERPATRGRRPAGGWSAPDFDASSEVDLRGLRADEVASKLAPAIDAAIQAALPSVRIIHGKGTGALRQVVTELLRADSRVTSFRAGGIGEGGAGVTVVELG
jgi:DNA mismatch repair protein MutS2